MGLLLWLLIIIISAIIIAKLCIKLTTGWCRSQVCLVGKTAIVTGANTGIGYETAIDLAKRGARVILACRDKFKGKDAVETIIEESENLNVVYKHLDLASLKSVRGFAEDVNKTEPRLDILINNAGAFGLEGTSEDGLNLEMQVNYFGHFLLTNLLLDLLKKSAPSRIVNVSSLAARERKLQKEPLKASSINNSNFDKSIQYARTKLANILFTIELNSRLRGTKVTTYSLHPGVILTDIFKAFAGGKRIFVAIVKGFFKNTIEGAQTTIYCAVEKGIEELSGEHFADCQRVKRYETVDDEEAKALWKETEKILKLK